MYVRRSFGEDHSASWSDIKGNERSCKKYQAYFKDYVTPYQNFLLVEFFISICLAVLDFQLTRSLTHCRVLNGVMLALMLLHLALVLSQLPLNKPLAFHFFLASVILKIISSGVSLTKSLMESSTDPEVENSNASRVLGMIATFAVLLSSIVFAVKMVISAFVRFQDMRQWVTKHKTMSFRLNSSTRKPR